MLKRHCFPSCDMVTFWANIGEKEYYEKQFATLRSFEEVDSIEESNVMSEEDDIAEQKQSEFAMKISNYANMILLALKVVLSRFILIPFLTFI